MTAKDIYHDVVKRALEKDGWTITHDPLRIQFGRKKMFVDLGAERLLAAEKGSSKIAVEVKSFLGKSEINDIENALGQFVLYGIVLSQNEPQRTLFLAVSDAVFVSAFADELGKLLVTQKIVRLLIFNPETEEIVRWIN